jgi:protein-S-isoprenylcysteine O-methyltransferase Ste14
MRVGPARQWLVPALFATAALVTAARAVDGVGHAVAHPGTREWLEAVYDLVRAAVSAAFALFTVGRAAPRRPARRPLAFGVCTVAVVAVVVLRNPPSTTPDAVVVSGELIAVAFCLWLLVSVCFLGRCFGVLPEARGLVTRGPYGIVRHPVYLGEIGACLGLVVAAPLVFNGVILGMFLTAQFVRMGLEERALMAAFPEYESYARRIPRLVPSPLGARQATQRKRYNGVVPEPAVALRVDPNDTEWHT